MARTHFPPTIQHGARLSERPLQNTLSRRILTSFRCLSRVPSINEIFVSDGPEPTASLGDSLELSYRTGSSLDNATSPFAFGSRGSLPLYLSPGTNSPLATSATSEATELSGLDLNVVAILYGFPDCWLSCFHTDSVNLDTSATSMQRGPSLVLSTATASIA